MIIMINRRLLGLKLLNAYQMTEQFSILSQNIQVMKTTILSVLALALILCEGRAQEVPNKDSQIAQALLAAPMGLRANARVLGFDKNGRVLELRAGTNEMVCIARDPSSKNFSVACYHKDLDPFMARGRELKAQGMDFKAIFDIREEEAKSGKLKIPNNSTLMVLTGTEDAESGIVTDSHLRYVVYIPFATSAETGLPEAPLGPGAPWIMNPGTHRAHIMITPPKPD